MDTVNRSSRARFSLTGANFSIGIIITIEHSYPLKVSVGDYVDCPSAVPSVTLYIHANNTWTWLDQKG